MPGYDPTEPYAVALKPTTYVLREDVAIGSLVVCVFSSSGSYAELWDGKPHNGLLCQAREDFKAGELVYPDQYRILCRVGQRIGCKVDDFKVFRPDFVGANQTSLLVDQPTQPKYGESAMTSEAINGGPPKPKLEWRVERTSDEVRRVYRFRIGLHVDGLLFATADVDRPEAGELSARQSRKLERKIEEAKAGIMRTYLLTVRQSGPANRTV